MSSTTPQKRKHQVGGPQHPLDSSGVLEAAKFGKWNDFAARLEEHRHDLTFTDVNSLPPGRSFGVIHQIAYHGNADARDALECLLEMHPRVDLTLPTKEGQTAWDVAEAENADDTFLEFWRERLLRQIHHELINKARDGEWPEFWAQLSAARQSTTPINVETINSVPPGRTWGILHQVCYWGDVSALEKLCTDFPSIDLEIETNEEAAQLPRDIAVGRSHVVFAAALTAKLNETKKPAAAASKVTAPSSAMKVPVPAAGKLCNICYMDEHEPDVLAVSCDNDHYMCQTCFAGWVESESNIDENPQNIIINGGRITCVCKHSSGCESLAFANKLIAMVVSDELYEKYLRARDFVVGKEAVSGALSKIKGGDMDAVEQEQIRNMYRSKDGKSYSAYMCGQCQFGPIDHGWCSDLSSHHGEKKQGGGSINNACPKCGWFANQIAKWPRWDGKFQSANAATKFKPPPVASMSVSELKVALKARGAPVGGNKAVLMKRLQALYDQQT